MDLKKVSIRLPMSENPEEELPKIAERIRNLPLVLYAEDMEIVAPVKAKFADIDGTAGILIQNTLYGTEGVSLAVTGNSSCVEFKKTTPEYIKLVHDGNVFFVILKTEEN